MTDQQKPNLVELSEIRRQVVERAGEESVEDVCTGGGGGEVNSGFIRQCLWANELGDGVLYTRLNQDKFLYVKSMGQWLIWSGHHWEIDIMDRHKTVMESVVKAYSEEADRVAQEISETQDKNRTQFLESLRSTLKTRCRDLRSLSRRNNALAFAHTCEAPMAIRGEEIDTRPWMLPCKNGVVNLETGELEAGYPKHYLLKAAPTPWKGIDAECPVWEQALTEMMDDDPEMVAFLQRLFGYSLVGEVLHSIFVVMTGKGRNGKSTVVEIMGEVLGPLAGAVRSEMLLDQSFIQSSRGPTPDIMALKGLRVAFASETGDNCRVSAPRVKWLTGKDTLSGRNPHDKYEISFKPSHTLFLLTNYVPHAPGDDFAFWERMICIPFPLSFVDRIPKDATERKADPRLHDKLKKELPGILAWMVRGCLMWQSDGLDPPLKVVEANKNYQANEDFIQEFIDTCCLHREGAWVAGGQLYSVFEIWYKSHIGNFVPKIKRFGTLMSRRLDKKKDGVVKYLNIELSDAGRRLLDQAEGTIR